MGRVVLDSSVWIAVGRGTLRLSEVVRQDDQIFLPAAVLAELLVSQHNSKSSVDKRAKSREFVAKVLNLTEFVPAEKKVAELVGKLFAQALTAGRTSNGNDLWIAATAIHVNAELSSLDEKAKFHEIPELAIRA